MMLSCICCFYFMVNWNCDALIEHALPCKGLLFAMQSPHLPLFYGTPVIGYCDWSFASQVVGYGNLIARTRHDLHPHAYLGHKYL